MRLTIKFLLSVFVTLFFASTAFAKIDPVIVDKIENACVQASTTNMGKKKAASICKCIAQTHFGAALKEPSEADGQKQLQWVLDYYQQIKDPKKLKEVLARPESIEEFDLMVAEECEKTAKGK